MKKSLKNIIVVKSYAGAKFAISLRSLHVIYMYADDVRLPLPPAYQLVHTVNVGEAFGIAALAENTREDFMEQAAAPAIALAQRLQPRQCTSQEGHRWLVDCRYEPPRCGAAWCGHYATLQ